MRQGEYTDGGFNVHRRFWGRTKGYSPKHERDLPSVEDQVRNVDCKHYLACLEAAALANARDLGCKNCPSQMDNTYKMTIQDFIGLMRLYYEISGARRDR